MNNWNQSSGNGPYAEKNGIPHTGKLLRDYGQGQNQQHPPTSQPTPQGPRLPMSMSPNQSGLIPQRPPTTPSLAPTRQGKGLLSQNWVANTMQVVRSWSGKMASVNGYTYQQPEPLTLYRPPTPDASTTTQPKAKPWKRSRTLRLTTQRRHRREREGFSGQKLGMIILVTMLILTVILTSSGSAYAFSYYQSFTPRVQGLANQQIMQTTHIYDRNGVLLKDVYDPNGGGRRTPVTYQDIPQVMQDAMISAEDHTFWTNSGVDPQGILRAATCGGCSGGSTITQQLIKNLTKDDTYSIINRKIPEATMAIGLTQQYPKWKILEMYLNIAPFGSQELGVETATQDYFHLVPKCDKSFKCEPAIAQLAYNSKTKKSDPLLALARASLLAGMPQNPVTYDPTLGKASKQYALGRQSDILNEMLTLGISVDGLGPITPDIVQKAEDLTAKMTFTRYTSPQKSPHFTQWITDQLTSILGTDVLQNGGFNIRTTIDSNLENYVETAVKRHLTQPDRQRFPYIHEATLNTDDNVNDAAVVVMNAKTGEILAMDGSTNYTSNDPRVSGQNNMAVLPRQPGSTFKPIEYATAFNMGWYPGMVLGDTKTLFPPYGSYHPTDYGATYGGGTPTIRVALATSRNVPAVKAFEYAGIDNVTTTARRLGITAIDQEVANYNATHKQKLTVDTKFGLAMALGTVGIPLVQMVGAYQVFADGGLRVPPQGILDIWDNYGHHLYHYDPPTGIRVLSPQVAFLMTSVLSDEPARRSEFLDDHDLSFSDQDPTCAYISACAHPVAAKTGTTDDFKDNLTIGYTQDVVVGVWAGNTDDSAFTGNVVGITGAAPIWHSVIEHANGYCSSSYDQIPCSNANLGFSPHPFTPPPGVHLACVSAINGLQGNCATQDWMIDGQDPLQTGIVQPTTPATTPTPPPAQ